MLKKNMTPCLINQKSSDPSLSISNFFMTPLPFCRPLEINNDGPLAVYLQLDNIRHGIVSLKNIVYEI